MTNSATLQPSRLDLSNISLETLETIDKNVLWHTVQDLLDPEYEAEEARFNSYIS